MKQALILIGLAAFFVAATVLRVEEFADETDSWPLAWSYGIVMLGATLGPALVYVRQAPKYRLAREAYRTCRLLKRHLRRAEKELNKAKRAVVSKARHKQKWTDKAERQRAEARLSRKEE